MRLTQLRRLPIRLFRLTSLSFALFAMVGFTSQASATVCDTDPGAVDFQATVDPQIIEDFLSALGEVINIPDDFNLTIPGICVDHQITIEAGFIALITDAAPFMVSPIPGSITVQVDLIKAGGYEIGIDGGDYTAVNCDSLCVFEIPYIGLTFDGCDLEADLVEPILSVLQVGASWDLVRHTQIADTCVTSSCEAVHPTTFTNADLVNFDVDVVGGCEICIPIIDGFPLPFDPCIDICSGLDGLIEDLIESPLTDLVTAGFELPDGEGLLIKALTLQIRKDQGCMDIPEVIACREGQQPAALDQQQAAVVPSSGSSAANAALYLAPLAGVVFVLRRLRRRPNA